MTQINLKSKELVEVHNSSGGGRQSRGSEPLGRLTLTPDVTYSSVLCDLYLMRSRCLLCSAACAYVGYNAIIIIIIIIFIIIKKEHVTSDEGSKLSQGHCTKLKSKNACVEC